MFNSVRCALVAAALGSFSLFAQKVTHVQLDTMAVESVLTLDQITAGGNAAIPPEVLSLLSSGAFELRHQVSYDAVQQSLLSQGVILPVGSPLPSTPDMAIASLWSITVAASLADTVSTPQPQVTVIGTVKLTGGILPFGQVGGSSFTFSAAYAEEGDQVSFTGISTAFAGVGSMSSPTGAGSIHSIRPSAAMPRAIAGPKGAQITLPQIQLDGTTSYDPDGAILTYKWALLPQAGQDVSLARADTATPVANITPGHFAFGTYTFQLTVTNPSGLTSSDTVTILYVDPSEVSPMIRLRPSLKSLPLLKGHSR